MTRSNGQLSLGLKPAVTSGQIGRRRFSRSWSYLRRIGRWLEQTTSIFSKTLNDNGSPTENGFRLLIEDAKQTAKVTRDVSVSEVADFSILREAQRELGITVK